MCWSQNRHQMKLLLHTRCVTLTSYLPAGASVSPFVNQMIAISSTGYYKGINEIAAEFLPPVPSTPGIQQLVAFHLSIGSRNWSYSRRGRGQHFRIQSVNWVSFLTSDTGPQSIHNKEITVNSYCILSFLQSCQLLQIPLDCDNKGSSSIIRIPSKYAGVGCHLHTAEGLPDRD